MFDNVEFIYADPGGEHEDNMRFLRDCEEKLFGQKVTIVRSSKYKDIFDVFEKTKYLVGPAGARCTTEMKKLPIRDYLGHRLYSEPQVFGFDAKEKLRISRFRENNPDIDLRTPLFDEGIKKADALKFLKDKGIDLPAMYRLGFSNANCMGCVKADSIKYWAKVRRVFPERFDWYAKFERTIGAVVDGKPKGASINRILKNGKKVRVFLDEIGFFLWLFMRAG